MKKQQSFLKSTAILIFANTISKILGAVFKIPLAYILKEEGMAIFNTAMSIYSIVLSFIISGFPLAISRLIAEEYALKNFKTVKKTVSISTVILCVMGLIGSIILYFFSDFFAYSMKDPKACTAIRIISPSVFFVAWGTVYKSYYQGSINIIPTAVSQIVEAVIKLVIGFLGAYSLINTSVEIVSAGAISGITMGEIIATLILFFLYFPAKCSLTVTYEKRSTKSICASLMSVAIPMLLSSCITGALDLLDVATIRNSLTHIKFTDNDVKSFLLSYSSYTDIFDKLIWEKKLSVDGARWLYGAYSGFALTIFHLPTGIIASLGVSVLSMVSGAIAKNNLALAEKTVSLSLKLTLIIALPCALVLFTFSEQILYLLFKNTASAKMLQALAPCLLFVCVSQLFTVILHASGYIFIPFFYSLIGIFIKLCANFLLIPIAGLNIFGAIIGSNIAFFIIMLLNTVFIKRKLKMNLGFISSFLKALFSTTVMWIITRLLYSPMQLIFSNDSVALFVTLFISGICYILSLLTLNAVSREEFDTLHMTA